MTPAHDSVSNRPIGVFDSGVGGLTVAAAITALLPAEHVIYLGDTARLPYGNKSPDTVRRYASNTATFLIEQGVKALVIACNTASSVALGHLKSTYSIPVLGVIEPGARAAVEASQSARIGVIGTHGTISSGAYQRALYHAAPNAHIIARACPLFVPLAEEGFIDHPATALIAASYLDPLKHEEIDTLVLGCTHYPLLAGIISRIMGDSCAIINSAQTTARALHQVLQQLGLLRREKDRGTYRFYATDISPRFQDIASSFFDNGFTTLSHVDIVT